MSRKISLGGERVEEGVDRVGAAGPGDCAGVLAHVGKLDLLDDQVAIVGHFEADVIAVGRLAVRGGPNHAVVPNILALLKRKEIFKCYVLNIYNRNLAIFKCRIVYLKWARY